MLNITATDVNGDEQTSTGFYSGASISLNDGLTVGSYPGAVGVRSWIYDVTMTEDNNGNITSWTYTYFRSYTTSKIYLNPEISVSFSPVELFDWVSYTTNTPQPISDPGAPQVSLYDTIVGQPYNYIGSSVNDYATFAGITSFKETLFNAGGTARGGDGNDYFVGGNGADHLYGDAGDDTITGGYRKDVLDGGAGNDTLNLNLNHLSGNIYLNMAAFNGTAPVFVPGGTTVSGFETFHVATRSAVAEIDMRGASLSAPGQKGSFILGAGPNIIRVDAQTTGSADIYGSNMAALIADMSGETKGVLAGSGVLSTGDNSLRLYSNTDLAFSRLEVIGGSGNDTLSGNKGNDILSGEAGDDYISGGFGLDILNGGAGNDRLGLNLAHLPGDIHLNMAAFNGPGSIAVPGGTTVSGFETFYITTGAGDADIDMRGASLSAPWLQSSFSLGGVANIIRVDAQTTGSAYISGSNVAVLIADMSGQTQGVNVGTGGIYTEDFSMTVVSGGSAFSRLDVTGGSGNDVLDGTSGNDILSGGAGDDRIAAGGGADTLRGGTGNDKYVVYDADDQIIELADEGVDLVQSWVTLTLAANIENLTLSGYETVNGTGNSLVNVLTGNSVANVLDGGLGNDTMIGGAGNDIYVVDSIGDRVFETTTTTSLIDAGGIDIIQSSVALSLDAYAAVRFVERLTLTGIGNINGTGNGLDNVLIGNTGNNTLNGGLGNDIMGGGAGNDIYVVDSANDRVFETTTISTLIDAGGVDTIQSSVTMNLDAYAAVRFVERLTLTGTGNIDGAGNALDNVMIGNSGNNTLNGGLGNDTMVGGAGNDIYVVDSASDFVFETTTTSSLIDAGGLDTIQSSVTTSLDAYAAVRFVENLTLIGAGKSSAFGNGLDNVLIGNVARNTLNGGLGNDTMIGGAGDDIYVVDSIGDQVFETTTTASLIDAGGVDLIQSSVTTSLDAYAGLRFVERLTLTGSGNIDGFGNELDNVLTGNFGNNTLNGALGNDLLIGSLGNDMFVFSTMLGVANIDQIASFSVADDTIGLDDAIFVGLAPGVLAASAFAQNLTGEAAAPSDRIIYETDTGDLFYDVDGVGGVGRVQFATLSTGLALTNADFFVF